MPLRANLVGRRDQGHRRPATATTTASYVVIAGGDDVIPFFRYPDVVGSRPGGASSTRPCSRTPPSGASLDPDQVLSQDAYGADTDVTIGGVTLPRARPRRRPAGEDAPRDRGHHLPLPPPRPTGRSPTPTSHLDHRLRLPERRRRGRQRRVHRRVNGAGATHDTLIDQPGTPQAQLVDGHRPRRTPCSAATTTWSTWPATSAPTTPWPPTSTTDAREPTELDDPSANAGKLTEPLVLSAGCHSGYNMVN